VSLVDKKENPASLNIQMTQDSLVSRLGNTEMRNTKDRIILQVLNKNRQNLGRRG